MNNIKNTVVEGIVTVAIICVIVCFINTRAEGATKKMTETAIDQAVKLIADFEGFRSYVYTCPGGKKTIGYGFTDAELIKKGSITKAEADLKLRKECEALLTYVKSKVTRKLTDKQYAALISFTYNVGKTNFANSTLLKKINAGATNSEISAQFNRWVYSGKTQLAGLVKRRAKEAKTYTA